jgi:hypothetical protein
MPGISLREPVQEKTFQVQFNVTLDLPSGKSLAVLGSIEELGSWDKK